MEANGCDNVSVERLSSEDFSSAFEGKGTAAVRLSSGATLADYDLHTLLVDPPRAGMDERTCHVATTFKRVVYISCNPETMVRDIQRMVDDLKQSGASLSIDRFAVFDQFPYTDHLECGALLSIDTPNPRLVGSAPKTGADQEAVVAAALEELRA